MIKKEKQIERLQKIIARAGVTSRRKAEELILNGRVTVNGVVVKNLGIKANPFKDKILVNGKPITFQEKKVYLFYKPKEVLSTTKDPLGRKTIKDFFSHLPFRVYPIGRLDYNSEGLILVTNDGELCHRLTHPSFKIPKTYEVKIRGHPDRKRLLRLIEGIKDKKEFLSAVSVELLKRTKSNTWIEVVLIAGKNRQIRRMCERIGHPVLKLKRIAIGTLTIGDLSPGTFRELKKEEINALLEVTI